MENAAGAMPTSPSGVLPKARSEDAFRIARRHSRTVRVLKWMLPTLAVFMALAFVAKSYLSAPVAVEIKAEGTALSDGKLVMSNPKLEGFTKDNRPYSMTAMRAVQDVANEAIVMLEGIGAKLPIDAANWATVDAARGTFDRVKNTLDLNSEITITTADGMVAKLKSAYLDIGAGLMTSKEPVDIMLDGARITSDTMSIAQNGKLLVFDKRVKVNIDPRAMDAAGGQDTPTR
jgi:lipopolysaccharide export system protein LptC